MTLVTSNEWGWVGALEAEEHVTEVTPLTRCRISPRRAPSRASEVDHPVAVHARGCGGRTMRHPRQATTYIVCELATGMSVRLYLMVAVASE